MDKGHQSGRRRFLAWGAASAAAPLFLGGRAAAKEWIPGQEMQYRTLGTRTGLKVSEVGFGGFSIGDPDVIHYAADQGINYIDTAWDYRGGRSEEVIGKAMKTLRDKFVLTTKWHPWARTKKSEMLEMLNTSLRRLQTDHVDCLLVHQVGEASGGGVERLQNEELYEAYETAKQQGKVRFTGVSGHDGDLMEVMGYAIDRDYFDVLLMRYNFMRYEEQKALISRAKEKGIGVVAMKTLSGAKGENDARLYRKNGASVRQAALKWVLSNPDVSNLIITMTSKDQIREYAAVSGARLGAADRQMLEYYAATYGSEVCHFCNECEPDCPHELPVAHVLRHYMYAENYGEVERGRLGYLELGPQNWADRCAGCDAPCESHCPTGVAVKREMGKAHAKLGKGATGIGA